MSQQVVINLPPMPKAADYPTDSSFFTNWEYRHALATWERVALAAITASKGR